MAHIQRNLDGSLMYPIWDPRNFETGFSEFWAKKLGQALTKDLGSDLFGDTYASKATMYPVYNDAGKPTGAYQPLNLPQKRTQSKETNAPQINNRVMNSNTGGGSSEGSNTTHNTNPNNPENPNRESEFERMVARARAAFESALRDADAMLERAARIREENLGLLGKRRNEFKDLYDTGNLDITNEYQERGGELGEAAQNRRRADAAALQAMGFGGSALERMQNRQSRDELRALRQLQQARDENKKENFRQLNERNTWADQQEAAANRAYEDAVNARRSLGERAGLVFQGDVDAINREAGSYLNNILARQNALAEMGGGINRFVVNPLAVNIPTQADALAAQNYSVDHGKTMNNQDVSLEEQKKKLALLNLQAGGNLYGLA